jgi:hypothetical protein
MNAAGYIYSDVIQITSYSSDLCSISLDSGTLSPAFTASTTIYTAACKNSSIKISPKAANAVHAITVNDSTVSSGGWSESIPLNVGTNIITINVLSLDELYLKTYTITVTRTDTSASETALSSIGLDSGYLSPAFDSSTYDYTASTLADAIKVTPIAVYPVKSITVNGSGVASGALSQSIALTKGTNTITIRVTALDGVTTRTYTIVVTRTSMILLQTISSFSVSAPQSVTAGIPFSFTVTAKDKDGIPVTGYTGTVHFSSTDIHALLPADCVLTNGTGSFNATLKTEGGQALTATDTSSSTVIGHSAAINVSIADSNDANLSGITLDAGSLSPTFTADTTSYCVTPDNSKSTISLTFTPEESHASLNLDCNGYTYNGLFSLSNIPLNIENNIIVQVVAQDGITSKTYYIRIPAVTPDKSTIDYKTASSWAVSELKQAEAGNLVTDKVMSSFGNYITREEFCGLAVKLYEALSGKQALPTAYNPFTDTSDIDTLKAVNLGIVKGVTADTFAPGNNITREEICVMLFRAIQAAKPGLDLSTSGVGIFTDENKIASWALDAVRFANKHGIMKGTGDNCIDPLSDTSREQAIILVKRTFESL